MSDGATFSRGDVVFNVDGQEGEYLMPYEDSHIVLPKFREDPFDHDVEPWAGEPAIWHVCFTRPPVPVVHEDVAEARKELDKLEAQVQDAEQKLRKMQDERRELQRDHAATLARLKEHRALARIDDWLAGNITHLVVWEHYGRRVRVKTWTEFMKGDGRRDSMPLLVLNGTMEWVDEYARMGIDWIITKQDSYTTHRVILCNSEFEAFERAREAIEKLTAARMLERRRNNATGYDHELEDLVKSMVDIGMAVPGDVAAAYDESRRAAAKTSLSLAAKKLDEAQRELQQADAAARAAGVEVNARAA